MTDYTRAFIDGLAEDLMRAKGFDEESKRTSPLEWDFDEKDSQISMCREDVEAILESFDKRRPLVETSSSTSSTSVSYFFTPASETPKQEKKKVQTSAVVNFILDNNPTISELREWLSRVELLGLDETTEIDGSLTLTITIEDTFVDKIICGDCDSENLVIAECSHEV